MIFSAYDYEIKPHDKQMVKTDIQIAVPDGCYGRVGKMKCIRIVRTYDNLIRWQSRTPYATLINRKSPMHMVPGMVNALGIS